MTEDGQPRIHDSRHCGGKKKQGEGLCTRPAGWGTDHVGAGRCKLHGGCAPSGSKSGRDELVERQVRELFGKVVPESTPVDNPLAAYATFAGRVMAWMELLDALLGDLRTVGYEHEKAGEQIRAVVQLYERSMSLANTVLSSYARLKIDERLAAISEAQKTVIIRAIEAALEEAGLEDEAAANAKRTAARHLRSA